MRIPDTLLRLLFRLLAFPLLLVGVLAAEWPVEKLESFELGLGPDASLIEACFHAQSWPAAQAGEQARVIILDEGGGSSVKVRRAAVVYTAKGTLRARDFRGPAQPLQGLTPADFDKTELLREHLLKLPKGDAPVDTRESDRILPDALMRLRQHPQGFGFPLVISGVQSKVTRPDGSTESIMMPWIVCDFEDMHCLYGPGVGSTMLMRIPTNTFTGKPNACVPQGDLVEALVFQADFRRQMPGEKAELLVNFDNLSNGATGDAAVAFTQQGKLRLYNLFLGTMDYPDHRPKDLASPAMLVSDFRTRLQAVFNKELLKKRNARTANYPRYPDLVRFVGLPASETMLADTPQLQVLRLHQRFLRAGLASQLRETERSEAGFQLSLEVEGRLLRYAPGRGLYLAKVAGGTEGVNVRIKPRETELQQKAMPRIVNRNAGQATAFVPDAAFIAHLEEESAKGKSSASRELAELLLQGRYVPRDVPRAKQLLGEAADKGDGESALTFARLLNKETLDDEGKARQLALYRIAAMAGFSEAQYNLGAMISSGRGCKRDYVLGLAWLIVAGKNGVEGTGEQELRATLNKKPELIAEAEGRASELWLELRRLGQIAP